MMVRFLIVAALGFMTSVSSQVLASECLSEGKIEALNLERSTILGRTASCVISESKILGQFCVEDTEEIGDKLEFTGIGWCSGTVDGEHAGHRRGLQVIHPDLGYLMCTITVWHNQDLGHSPLCTVFGSTYNNIDMFSLPPLGK